MTVRDVVCSLVLFSPRVLDTLPVKSSVGERPGRRASRVPFAEGDVIRILLVEPMSLLRGALATVLAAEPDLEIAGQTARIEELVPLSRAVRPDIVVVAVDLLVGTDMAMLDELEKEAPDCALVALVDVDTPGAVGGDLQP